LPDPLNPKLPNFFIGGAPNTGTTSLYFYLRQHPEVFMCPVKEPSFFGGQEFVTARHGAGVARERYHKRARARARRLITRSGAARSWEEYVALFQDAREEPAIGEVTPRYLLLPGAAREIHQRIPHAKLIFILRDPADWLLTRYVQRFWPDRASSFRQRFLAGQDAGNEWAAALNVGRYATHLERFFDVFPPDQIQVHLYDDLRRDAREFVRKMLAFLGVDPEYPIDVSHRHNARALPRFPGLHSVRRLLTRDLPVGRLLPAAIHGMLRRVYYRSRPSMVMDPADRQLVIEYYRDEIVRTAALIRRDLSAWLLP
jgi:hypothetical protein